MPAHGVGAPGSARLRHDVPDEPPVAAGLLPDRGDGVQDRRLVAQGGLDLAQLDAVSRGS